MATYCPNCGTELTEALFCENCKANVTPLMGFSDRVHDPALIGAINKIRKDAWKIVGIVMVMIIIGCVLVGLASGIKPIGIMIALGVVADIIIAVVMCIKSMIAKESNSYEGVVTDKYIKQQVQKRSNGMTYKKLDIHYVCVQKENGRKKVFKDRSAMTYNYLDEGDKICYHAQLIYPFEKYNKSSRDYLICNCCSTKNSLAQENCSQCGTILLK